ncbi:MAG: cobyrinate a,c-diamide synthase [Bdellovibrionales bacterium]|nr:cobyrinate a,c-diamide synthase [Bdellovibrionales bacterium]
MSEDPTSAAIDTPRILVAGIGRKVGTSTVILGLLVNLKRAGISVAMAKVGPSLVDTTIHRRVAGRLSHTMDSWMLDKQQLQSATARLSAGAEMIIFEGNAGIYDKSEPGGSFETLAEFARNLSTPIVLVVDAFGLRESIAAIVQGACQYGGAHVMGVIANRVHNEAHNNCLRDAVERLGGPKYIAGIPIGDERLISGGTFGQAQGNPSLLTRNRLLEVGSLVNTYLDLDALREVASHAGTFLVDKALTRGENRRCRIAVADDAAFHLTIQDNLDLMRRAGAEIVAFSPLADIKLPPKTGGIYIPGGYVHLYAKDLSANESMLGSIRNFANAGGAIYTEGNSIAYMCREAVLYSGISYKMLGLLPGVATSSVEETSVVDPVYSEVVTNQATILSRTGDVFRGLRDTRWLIRTDEKVLRCFQVADRHAKSDGTASALMMKEGYSPLPHVLVTSMQAHWGSNASLARMFVDSASASDESAASSPEP